MENEIKVEEKKTKKMAIVIVLLVIVILGLGGYILYDKVIANKDETPINNDNPKQEDYITDYSKLPEESDNSLSFVSTLRDIDIDDDDFGFDVLNKDAKLEKTINGIKFTFTCDSYDEPPFPCSGNECRPLDANGKRCVMVKGSIADNNIDFLAYDESATCTIEENIVKSDNYYLIQTRNCSPYSEGTTLYDLSGNIVKDFSIVDVCGQKNVETNEDNSNTLCEENDLVLKNKVVYFSGQGKIYSYIDMSKNDAKLINVE